MEISGVRKLLPCLVYPVSANALSKGLMEGKEEGRGTPNKT